MLIVLSYFSPVELSFDFLPMTSLTWKCLSCWNYGILLAFTFAIDERETCDVGPVGDGCVNAFELHRGWKEEAGQLQSGYISNTLFLNWSNSCKDRAWQGGIRYFLKCYKEPIIFPASLAVGRIYEFHLRSAVKFSRKKNGILKSSLLFFFLLK